MTKLDHALKNVNLLGLDTAPLIYFVEANPRYSYPNDKICIFYLNPNLGHNPKKILLDYDCDCDCD